MRIIFLIFLILISFSLKADMIKPNSSIKALDVILIQLKALQNNDFPFENAGIEQTWEFAHPNNRAFTGPLDNFIRMIKNPSYSMMLNHLNHEIIPILNKIDLPASDIDKTKKQIEDVIGIDTSNAVSCSGKTGDGIEDILPYWKMVKS